MAVADTAPVVNGAHDGSSVSRDRDEAGHASGLYVDLTGDGRSEIGSCAGGGAVTATALSFGDVKDELLLSALGEKDTAEDDGELSAADWLDVTISMLHPEGPDLEIAR